MARKQLCCTDNLFALPVCGVFVSLLGLVLLIIYLVARGITSSLHLVEAPIPTYIAALLTISLGIILIILLKKRHILLICCSILLSVLDLIVCTVHAVTAGLVSIPFLGSFSVCVLRATSAECQCYILGDGTSNSSVIVPGDGTKHYTFRDVKSCSSIQTTLKEFLYTLCIVYSFVALGCVVAGALSTLLLCGRRRLHKSTDEADAAPSRRRVQETSHNADETQDRSSSIRRSLDRPATAGRPASRTGREVATPVTHQASATPQSVGRTSGSGPVRRSLSVTTPPTSPLTASSATAAPGTISSSSGRPPTRSHSTAGSSTENGSRQRQRLPILVRGGYLQSHVNGPRVPVYTLQGSNEAYIALTDLPRLQLPALDQVPAYVREVQDVPSYEPPPYSPVAETLSESPELREPVESSQTPTARQCLTFDAEVPEEQNIVSLQALSPTTVTEETQQPSIEVDQAIGSTDSLEDLQEETGLDGSQSIALGTDDILIHNTGRTVVEDSSHGVVNQGMLYDEEEEGSHTSASISTDQQPPDILMEAIESARSSLNVTANVMDISTNSVVQSDSPILNSASEISSSIAPSSVDMSSTSRNASHQDSSMANRSRPEQRLDAGMNSENRADRQTQRTQLDIAGGRDRHTSGRDSSQTVVEPTGSHLIRAASMATYNPSGEASASAPHRDQIESSRSRSREVKRSQSLNAAGNPPTDRSVRGKSPKSKKTKRHAATYGRERGLDSRQKALNYIYAPEEYHHHHNIVVTPKRLDRDRKRESGDRSRPRQSSSSNSENLSDILNLVETVRGTSVQTKSSSRKKAKKKSSKQTNVFDSKV